MEIGIQILPLPQDDRLRHVELAGGNTKCLPHYRVMHEESGFEAGKKCSEKTTHQGPYRPRSPPKPPLTGQDFQARQREHRHLCVPGWGNPARDNQGVDGSVKAHEVLSNSCGPAHVAKAPHMSMEYH